MNETKRRRIRGGSLADVPAMVRLFARAHAVDGIPRIDIQELTDLVRTNRLIALQLDATELAAVACVTRRGVAFVVLDPRIADRELEQRMIGVAEALADSER